MASWRTGTILVGSLLVTGGLLQACGSDGEAIPSPSDAGARVDAGTFVPVQTETKAAATIGNAGGKVVTTAGVGVEIPSGALPNDVQVSVQSSPTSTPPANATAIGTPHVFGPSGLQFLKPVTVVLTFDPAKLPVGKTSADIVVFTAPEGSTSYAALPTKLRDATHVEATTTHFSVMVPTVPDVGQPAEDAGPGNDGGSCSTRVCGYYGPATCGPQSDGCGGSLNCGPCNGGEDAGAADAGAADAGAGDAGELDGGTCQNPLTCANYEQAEGPLCEQRSDGCGGTLECTNGCGLDGGTSDAGADASPDASPDASGGDDDDDDAGTDAGEGPEDASVPDAAADASSGASDASADGGGCTPAAPVCEPAKGECGGFLKELGCDANIFCNEPCPAEDGGASDAGGSDAAADGG